VSAWERCKGISFEEVEHALPEKIRDNANMIAKVETISEVYAFVPVVLVVRCQCCQHSQFYSRGVTVFRNCSYNFHGTPCALFLVHSFDDLTEGALTQKFRDFVCTTSVVSLQAYGKENSHTSVRQFRIGNNYIMAIFIVNFFAIVVVLLPLVSMARVDLGIFFHLHLARHGHRRLML